MKATDKIHGSPTNIQSIDALAKANGVQLGKSQALAIELAKEGVGRNGEIPSQGTSATMAFLGPKIAAAIETIPQLRGRDFGAGEPAWVKVKLDADNPNRSPWNSAGIFFEAESKLTFADKEDVKPLSDALVASLQTGFGALLGSAEAKNFEGYTVHIDKPKSVQADGKPKAAFRDLYYDDAKGTLARAGGSVRERVIEGGKGKLETKIPGDWIGGSAVLGRFESSHSLETTDRADLFAQAGKPDTDFNPITVLLRAFPDVDMATLRPRRQVDDQREQYVIKDASGKDMYLMTLDVVSAIKLDEKGNPIGKRVHWNEFEVERMDGKVDVDSMKELVAITNSVMAKWNLTRSATTKDGRGAQLLGEID
jgi:hypothetical protein